MLHPPSPVCTQTVEAKAVDSRVDLRDQPGPQSHPLRRLDLAFEDGVLDTLSEIEAGARNPPQTPTPGCGLHVHVVGDEHQHGYFQMKAG